MQIVDQSLPFTVLADWALTEDCIRSTYSAPYLLEITHPLIQAYNTDNTFVLGLISMSDPNQRHG